MGEACIKTEEREIVYIILVRKPQKKTQSVSYRQWWISKWMFEKYGAKVGIGLSWLWANSTGRLCKHGNEIPSA
jgi:hypothetical protein